MAGSFRIAEGYVEVTADESSYDRAMARLTSNKHQVKVGVQLDDSSALAQLSRSFRDRSLKVTAELDKSALDGLKLRDVKVSVLAEINDAAYQRVQKALDKLTADRVVQIRANADTRVAANEISNLIRRQTVRIGIDVDTRVAADSIANLTRRRTMTVAADLNSADARARLDVLTRDRSVNLNVDVDRSALSRISSMFSGSSGGIGSMLSGTQALVAAAIAGLPAIASLGESLIQMGPAAAIAAPAVLSLASAFAAIKIGTSGIGDAFKAAFAPAASSASTALSATKAVESAQRSLAKAQQGVRDAEVNAASARVAAARQIQDAQLNLKNTVVSVADANRRAVESVTRAERDLATAQRAEKQAQEDLTQARKDAKQQLEDLNNQLADAHLNERDDILAVQDAQQNLDAVKAKGASATAEELAKAQLEYDKAVQALKEQQTATARLEEQTAAANAAGVDGSAAVVTAEQAVADAKQNTADQTQALKDAQIAAAQTATDGAQKVAKAQRDVADAQAAATKASTDGARAIADAQAAVADAARAVADAQTSATLKTNTLGQAMAKLSGNAREFVNAVIAQKGAWTALKLDVQDRLFRGLGGAFTTMARAALPSLRTGLVGTAGVLNTMAKNAANAVTQLAKTGMLKKLFEGLNGGLKPLSKVPGQFITGLTQIAIAAAPAFKRITTAAGGFADRLSKQLTKAFKNGHLEKVIDQALNIAVQFGKLIGNIFGTVGNVMKAAGKGGGDALGALGETFKTLRKITAMPEMQKAMTSIFTAINAVAKVLAGTVGKVVVQLFGAFAQIAPTITKVVGSLGDIGPLLGGILLATNPVLGVFVLLAPILGKLAKPIASLIASMGPLLKMLSDFASGLMSSLAPVIGSVIGVLAAVFKALAPVVKVVLGVVSTLVSTLVTALVPVINALIPVVGLVGQLFMQLVPIWQRLVLSLLPLLPPISQLAVSLVHLAMQVISPLLPLIVGLAQLLAGVLAGAIGILVPVLTTVIGWITKFVDAVSVGVKWVVDAFQGLYDTLVGHSIIPDLVKAIISWFTSLWTKTKQIFTDLLHGVINIWNALWSKLSGAWNAFYGGIRNAISGAGTWIRNAFSGLRTAVSNTWSGLWNGVKGAFSSIMNAVSSKLSSFSSGAKTAFSNLKSSLGTIWNGIRSAFSNPIKFVINTVYNNGIRKMWDAIASKVGLPQLPTIKLNFNKGGVVPGTGNRDTIPAMLTPNERILSNQQVARLGGHRAIDAMLGTDRPTGTGGNPSTKQEQGRQGFASGGIVGTIKDIGSTVGGALGSGLGWAENLVVGGLKAAAQKAISSIVRPLINRIPGGGTGDLMKGMANKVLSGILGFLGKEDGKATGGPAVQSALGWARTQAGKPYQWGGNGNPSWDCSGFMSAIESVIRGESPHRRWATGSFSGSTAAPGWVRNLVSPFQIGVTNAGVGHTAGTIGGVNVESRGGGGGVIVGPRARGFNDSLFGDRYGFKPATKFDTGGLLQPGATLAVNRTGKPERILDASQTAKLDAMLSNTSSAPGGVTVHMTVNSLTMPSTSERRQFATAMASDINEALRKWNKDRN